MLGIIAFYARALLLSVALPALIVACLCFAVAAQDSSRAEAIKEAGRLGTEAERLLGEAERKVRGGGDPRLLRESELAAAERFRRAIELWRIAGDHNRLAAGVEELSRIYLVLKDYESAVDCLKSLLAFWQESGDIMRQVNTLWLLSARQMQMQRDADALQTLEKVVAMSKAAGLTSMESSMLDELARLYEKFGRGAEAGPSRARAEMLREQIYHNRRLVGDAEIRLSVNLPSLWVDLPLAPLFAEYREVNGVRHAVLVNRGTKGIEGVQFGCVREQDGAVRVVTELGGVGRNHGGVRPGDYYQPFEMLNGPRNRWTDEKVSCEGDAKMTVIKALYADRAIWEAEGSAWQSR